MPFLARETAGEKGHGMAPGKHPEKKKYQLPSRMGDARIGEEG